MLSGHNQIFDRPPRPKKNANRFFVAPRPPDDKTSLASDEAHPHRGPRRGAVADDAAVAAVNSAENKPALVVQGVARRDRAVRTEENTNGVVAGCRAVRDRATGASGDAVRPVAARGAAAH